LYSKTFDVLEDKGGIVEETFETIELLWIFFKKIIGKKIGLILIINIIVIY